MWEEAPAGFFARGGFGAKVHVCAEGWGGVVGERVCMHACMYACIHVVRVCMGACVYQHIMYACMLVYHVHVYVYMYVSI